LAVVGAAEAGKRAERHTMPENLRDEVMQVIRGAQALAQHAVDENIRPA